MPIYRLTRALAFPPVEEAEGEGLLAVGGDLGVERLLLAYRSGIFPWYSKGEPVLWWSPDPRSVLFPSRLRVSHTMRRLLKAGTFEVTYDRAFADVIRRCARAPRRGQPGTWITDAMAAAYTRLHERGFAHSVETWRDGTLAGGLYGVALGGCFFGESMFAAVRDASKFALIVATGELQRRGCSLIDCQVHSEHMASLGAEPIPRARFLRLLAEALAQPAPPGSWRAWTPPRSSGPAGHAPGATP